MHEKIIAIAEQLGSIEEQLRDLAYERLTDQARDPESETAAEATGVLTVIGVTEVTGTVEAAAEASGVLTQFHTVDATAEAAAEGMVLPARYTI